MMDWVRLWHDMPTDPKWRVIARKSGRTIPEVIAVYVVLMTNASANATERGRTHNIVVEDISALFDLDEGAVTQILTHMEGKVIDCGRLTGWDKRQPKRERDDPDNAARSKAWRDAQKGNGKDHNPPERQQTPPNANEHLDKIREDKDKEVINRAFALFWTEYPKKRKKKETLRVWQNAKLSKEVNRIVEDVAKRKAEDRRWVDGYAPDPTTYLRGELWNDDIEAIKVDAPDFWKIARADALMPWCTRYGIDATGKYNNELVPKVQAAWEKANA